jgi:MerR HTH family regulatory protein
MPGRKRAARAAGNQKWSRMHGFNTIREMAREFHVTIRALRFYEDRGMLRPKRDGRVRRYDDRDRLP